MFGLHQWSSNWSSSFLIFNYLRWYFDETIESYPGVFYTLTADCLKLMNALFWNIRWMMPLDESFKIDKFHHWTISKTTMKAPFWFWKSFEDRNFIQNFEMHIDKEMDNLICSESGDEGLTMFTLLSNLRWSQFELKWLKCKGVLFDKQDTFF